MLIMVRFQVCLAIAWAGLLVSTSGEQDIGTPNECKDAPFVPGYNLAGEGFDVVTMERKSTYVVNTENWDKGNGTCMIKGNDYMNGQRQKLPAAVVFWRALPKCSMTLSSKILESSEALVEESSSSLSVGWKVGLNIKLVGAAVGSTHSREAKFAMGKSKTDKYTFTKHQVDCDFYRYGIAEKPPLHPEFLSAIKSLPKSYDPTAYRNLIITYGTHYTTQVWLGGQMKAITAIKTCQAAMNGLTESAVKDCLDVEASGSYSIATVKVETKLCKEKKKKMGTNEKFSSMFDERQLDIIGGKTQGVDLLFSGSSHPKVLQDWIESLKSIPDVIRYSLKPLYFLLSPNDPVREGLKRETERYIIENALMPRHCSAVGCKSRDTKDIRKSGITFHRLPKKGNPRRTTWIINSHRKGPQGTGQWDPQSGFIYFCSRHFTPDSFDLSGVSGYRRLKDDAIPTVFEVQPHERCTAWKFKTKRRGRPRKEDKDNGVEDSTKNVVSESQGIKNEILVPDVCNNERKNDDDEEESQGLSSDAPERCKELSQDQSTEPSSPQPSPRPPSPSCYMRRLPPPPGFYLPKEHSYAQLCPLVWRKRYNKAIDSLENALRLLSAARRRENRLRNALLRLREDRLKSTLFQARGRKKGRDVREGNSLTWSSQRGQEAKMVRTCNLEGLEEGSNEGTSEELDLLAEGWNGQTQTRGKVADDEDGCCFYCGRDNEGNKVSTFKEAPSGPDEGSHVSHKSERIQKTTVALEQKNPRTDLAPEEEQQSYYLYYCENAETEKTMQVMTMELQPHQLSTEEEETSLEIHNSTETFQQLALLHPQSDIQTTPGPVQFSTTLQETYAPVMQHIQVLQPNQGLILPDIAAKDKSETELEQQQFYWVQERTDDHVLMIPAHAETGEGNRSDVETVIEMLQPHEVLERFQSKSTEERDGCDSTTLPTAGWENGHVMRLSDLRTTVVGVDVRERLKEHLEGFQLQLSSEFTD
ncbi:hypothetical protein DNTS_023838 [Danionella cerebrum]|uniref:THAP-type domain-containing protein n=1 Tax=Danionella cerebrum TaxID=2873325 RepID=A0A553QT28_9TELE|nr:hypothetical protein DNTS_023838 [Danionella translucida]